MEKYIHKWTYIEKNYKTLKFLEIWLLFKKKKQQQALGAFGIPLNVSFS